MNLENIRGQIITGVTCRCKLSGALEPRKGIQAERDMLRFMGLKKHLSSRETRERGGLRLETGR